jgi:hypothetical protein
MSGTVKKRQRFQKVGSTHYEDEKRKLMARTRQGLFLTMEALTQKLEAGKSLRDEEIRFLKTFNSTIAALELKEEALETGEEVGLPAGKLREFIERVFQFKESTGYTDTRGDGLSVMEKAQYSLCSFCNEFHKVLDSCPFKDVAEERKVRLLAEKEKEAKDPNRPIDLTGSD